jgi:hypothetical protein
MGNRLRFGRYVGFGKSTSANALLPVGAGRADGGIRSTADSAVRR